MTTADLTAQASKSAPPALAWLIAFVGEISLNNIIGVVTLIYIVLQAGYLVWKWRRDIRCEREHRRATHKAQPSFGDPKP